MTTGTLKTQGTELYFISRANSDPEVVKVACPTGISGLGGPADQLDDTCLDGTERTFKRGLGNPGQVSVPINFIPSSASHQALIALQTSGENVDWLIGLSDGTAAPTLDSDGLFVAPPSPTRTSIGFNAYVSDFNIDIATNEIVRATLTLQRSGPIVPYYNGPTPT
jgi:hypothetical protein